MTRSAWWLRTLLILFLAVAVLVLIRLHSAAGETLDPHRLYEQKCVSCHAPHASELAKETLAVRDSTVVGASSGRPLTQLLTRHHGIRLNEAEVKALADHFAAMLPTGWLYRDKCTTCHDRAVTLARTLLSVQDGRLVGRYSGRDITAFLSNHGRLSPVEADGILAMLIRQLQTSEGANVTPAPVQP